MSKDQIVMSTMRVKDAVVEEEQRAEEEEEEEEQSFLLEIK
jgi:hypothetical protein